MPNEPVGTSAVHALGQRLWLDSISRELLTGGDLARYVRSLSVTGLTSNPTLFERAIIGSTQYDAALEASRGQRLTPQARFFALALQDLRQAADVLREIYDASNGHDGWVSLEVSPLLANDADATLNACRELHIAAARPNLFIKIPGTREGLGALEEAVFEGIPVNATLLFTTQDCAAAALAYLRAIERRLAAGRDPNVASVASLFVSRWDLAANSGLPPELRNRLGIATAARALHEHRARLLEPRWRRILNAGARPQRLLWASTGSKAGASEPTPECYYLDALVASDTIDTLPLRALQACAAGGRPAVTMPADGGDSAAVLAVCRRCGVDLSALGRRLQLEGIAAFAASWRHLLASIEAKT